MIKRTKLSQRALPDYTNAEECMNMVTHIVGGSIGILALVFCVLRAARHGSIPGVITSAIYGACMVSLYTVSSVYHGLRPGTAKKVMQVVDHCTIYFLIAGTYTPILVCSFVPVYPAIGWGLLIAQWGLLTVATVLTAIDLRRYRVFSMICYIGMGWGIVFFLPQTMQVLSPGGFYLVLFGGIAYTIGAILYGIGSKKRWMHSVFHIFVVLGSILQMLAIYFYVL